jgi:hypothetical protein
MVMKIMLSWDRRISPQKMTVVLRGREILHICRVLSLTVTVKKLGLICLAMDLEGGMTTVDNPEVVV